MTTDELRESLMMNPKNGYSQITAAQRQDMNDYCKRYMAFMDECKTEREATAWTEKAAIEHGIDLLEQSEGEIRLPKLLKAMDGWLEEKAKLALETQSKAIDTFRRRSANIGFRAGGIAFKLCGEKETSVVIDFALWVTDFVLQQQVAMWGQALETDEESNVNHHVVNLYRDLPEEFTREELVNLRTINGQGKNVRMIIKRWKDNGMILEMEQNRYVKTDKQA